VSFSAPSSTFTASPIFQSRSATQRRVAPDQKYRVIQREMAAEWLKLADAIRHPLKPSK
jgi:hypothetical protein